MPSEIGGPYPSEDVMDQLASTVMPLASSEASLALVGGKGRSLAKLVIAGLPVPAGFLISTRAYKAFVEVNELQETIQQLVAEALMDEASALERAEARIQALFDAAHLPDDIAASIAQAYAGLDGDEPAVAVRSSATAEDLPDMSFAGQQETFLNVRGESSVCSAVRRCWASLWTARAIEYRHQMDIDQRAVAMGVVVQLMAPADVSGILFTANPTSGERSEVVVNSSFGLGEAVVGGTVTPDTFVLQRPDFQLKTTLVGTKEEMIVPSAQGTVVQVVADMRRGELSLAEESLQELAALGVRVEQLFDGVPQDVEWSIGEGKCWLLQARPITNLPVPPLRDVSWNPPTKGEKLVRRQVVEHMPEPLSPLFDELYLRVGLEQSMDEVLVVFGMEFLDVSRMIERPMFLTVNGYAFCRGSYRWWRSLPMMPRIFWAYLKLMPRLLKTLISDWNHEWLPAYLHTVEQWKLLDLNTASDEKLLEGIRELTVADASYWFKVSMVVGGAKVTDGLLNWFVSSRLVKGNLTSGQFLCGFTSKTIEAQEALEAIAREIRQRDALRSLVAQQPAAKLLTALEAESDARDIVEKVHQYLQQYGHQIYNLDFVQPTLIEQPLPVLLSLKRLVEHDEHDTTARQAERVRERDSRIESTLASLGPTRRWLFRTLLRWAQRYGPHREEALFYLGAAWPALRPMALEVGRRLVAVGTLDAPSGVFFLESAEIEEACQARQEERGLPELGSKALQRRELREARKRLHPPGVLPEGARFTLGPINMSAFVEKRNADDAQTLQGFAVSPGTVTAPASVILSPDDFDHMQPGTILVCPTTTPAWTPLFSQAVGLATDIGGILAHGSIVAREYGIPAVMGTGNVTRRVASGQQITVDGDRGTVKLM